MRTDLDLLFYHCDLSFRLLQTVFVNIQLSVSIYNNTTEKKHSLDINHYHNIHCISTEHNMCFFLHILFLINEHKNSILYFYFIVSTSGVQFTVSQFVGFIIGFVLLLVFVSIMAVFITRRCSAGRFGGTEGVVKFRGEEVGGVELNLKYRHILTKFYSK